MRSFRARAVLPRRSGWRRQLQFELNGLRRPKTMEAFRYGFRLIWRGCPKYLKRIGMGRPGSYDETNHHGGEMFALPGEFSLNKDQAAKILFLCYKTGKFTFSQMRTIKKTLAYAYQLNGGIPGKNFSTVPGVWLVVQDEQLQPQQHFCVPTKVPLPRELRKVFTTEYREETGMGFMDWCRGLLVAWDWAVLGARSKEDLKRIKNGAQHGIDHAEGWAWTAYKGGRSKLCTARKGTRPWRAWRICMCIGKKHIPLPEDVQYCMDKKGNLLEPASWCTGCPVNCMELIFRTQDYLAPERHDDNYRHVRIYRKWEKTRGRAARDSQGEPVEFALKWLKVQGLERDYDTNAGRKALSRWLQELKILHPEGVQIHGDCEDVWAKNYQKQMPLMGYKERNQSLDPHQATAALRKFAMWCRRGPSVKPLGVSRRDRMLGAFFKEMGHGEKANKILNDFPSSSDED